MHRLNQVLCYVEMWFIEKSTKQKNPEKVFDKIQVCVRLSIINLAVLFQKHFHDKQRISNVCI